MSFREGEGKTLTLGYDLVEEMDPGKNLICNTHFKEFQSGAFVRFFCVERTPYSFLRK